MPSEQSLSTKFPYLKARKYLHITDQRVNIAPDVLQDLILHSKGAVISTLDSFPVVNGAISVPRSSIQDMFTVIDDYIAGIPYLPSDQLIRKPEASVIWLHSGSGCGVSAPKSIPTMVPY